MASHSHPIFARYYARASVSMERGIGGHRRELLSGLSGRVIEVGAGNGLNFGYYPGTVTEVVAVEPEPLLRRLAERKAKDAPVPITVVDGVAESLPVADGSCDGAVVSLVLCSVPDVPGALAELMRVLEPGGRLRFFEHVRSDRPATYAVQRMLDATVWPFLGGGCHCGRDTGAAIKAAGFAVNRLDRLSAADTKIPFPAGSQIFGSATRP